ncbi:hypothetical protein [Spirosoma sp. KNUC1025]|uniref:hypothetical protein n=1 Tax=Spirosoma sp. KNUC1025 TaxID=2894082 RepID=UPI0038672818|nr:hypothetical protein LN737_25035 [Spirosoma sp. KNUC1025]
MRLFLALYLGLLLALPGRGQERVRNVRLQVIDSSQIQIWYDLVEARPGDSIYVGMESRVRGEVRILPEFIRGDIGKRVTPGSNRRIVWDAVANGYPLNEDIRATVFVKTSPLANVYQPPSLTGTPGATTPVADTKPKETAVATSTPLSAQRTEPLANPALPSDSVSFRTTRYVGPAWALLSAVAPGMGNIFVQMPRPKIGFRPLVLVSCYGLIAYGLTERQKSIDEYAIYEQQKNNTDAEPYYQSANNHHHAYWLATRGAVAIAAADVILTFIRGLRNNRILKGSARLQSFSLRPGMQGGQPTAVLRYSF